MAGFLVPNVDDVIEMLSMLFGGDVDAVKITNQPAVNSFSGSFVDDSGALVSLCVASLSFVGYSGAALSMMPAAAAKDMIDENDLSKTLLENFYEVMNVCSRLFMSDSSPHLKLNAVHSQADTPAKLGELAAPRLQAAYEIAIPRYGKGQLHFLTK